tara:strand:+ start:1680 stop:2600 length:921 start_codon:yes stop_codon:yes gene_type:complete
MTEFKFIDLFAGIGGMRIPFDALGGKCVFSSEIDKHAQNTYKDNFNELPHGDIKEIAADEIPYHDLLLAGFPCQAFSHAGLKKGFNDTRGTLFFEIARVLEYHRPKAFLLENVRGLRSHDGGKTLKIMVNTLRELGYENLHAQILNAKDFGLPQNRARFFIIGLKDNNAKFSFPEKLDAPTKLGNILDDKVDAKYTISDKLWTSHQQRKLRNQKNGRGFGYSSFNTDSPYTRTISSRYYKDGSEILIEQNEKNPRLLTPKEAARLQGFPEGFILNKSDIQSYKQIGNAVPVNVVRAISHNLLLALN